MAINEISDVELKFLRLFASGFVTGGLIGHLIPIDKVAVAYAKLKDVYQNQLKQELKEYDRFDRSKLYDLKPEYLHDQLCIIIEDNSLNIRALIPEPSDKKGKEVTISIDEEPELHDLFQWYLNKDGSQNAIKNAVILYKFEDEKLIELIKPLLDLSSVMVKLEALKIVQDEIVLNKVYHYPYSVKTVPDACRNILKRVGGSAKITITELKSMVFNEYVIEDQPNKSTINDSINSWVQNFKRSGRRFKGEKNL